MELKGKKNARRKELIAQYKETRPLMGVFMIECTKTGEKFITSTQNLHGAMNSMPFKLNSGGYRCKALQKLWTSQGAENFEIKVLKTLDYDKKQPGKTDYHEELALMRDIWAEKLAPATCFDHPY